jgi:hypothetical protein
MRDPLHDELVEMLLASMSQTRGAGLKSSFMFRKPGEPFWIQRGGVELYYSRAGIIRTAIYLRRRGPAYLRYLSVDELISMLRDFISDNYWYLANETMLRRFTGSFADNVSAASKANLAEALSQARIFEPLNELTLFPLIPIRVESDFDSDPFFLAAANGLDDAKLRDAASAHRLRVGAFPPHLGWTGETDSPTAWLGVRAPSHKVAAKMKAAILGALALTPIPENRYTFSGREVFGGRCTLSKTGVVTSLGDSHTPPLMDDIVVQVSDHDWLEILASKLGSVDGRARREVRALEYYYRAWPLDESERFPVLCMTLDAIFGEATHAAQAVIDGVLNALGQDIDDKRLRKLMDLRASVIHGGAPDVFDSKKYAKYYARYEADPIYDLELIVAHCLRAKVFEGKLHEHPDPNAHLIEMARARGVIPADPSRGTILEARKTAVETDGKVTLSVYSE